MSSRELSAEERKERLNEARVALHFGDRAAWAKALTRLPATGAKAAELRQQLTSRLSNAQLPLPITTSGSVPHPTRYPDPAPAVAVPLQAERRVTGGLQFRFTLADLDSSALFQVRLRGAEVLITLNEHHPALVHVVIERESMGDPAVHPAFRCLLVAWARLELEGPAGVHRERLQQIREDLGRLMREDGQ